MGKSTYPPNVRRLLSYFRYEHLPEHLQNISKPFCELAYAVSVNVLPDEENKTVGDVPETVVCLRKLLEAKDAAVRARL